MSTHAEEIMGNRVKFTSGKLRKPMAGVADRRDGKFVVVKCDDGVERKVFPGSCTIA